MTDRRIEAATLGEAWPAVARAILGGGVASTYDGLPILELDLVTLTVTRPASADPLIERLGDPKCLAAATAGTAATWEAPVSRARLNLAADPEQSGADQHEDVPPPVKTVIRRERESAPAILGTWRRRVPSSRSSGRSPGHGMPMGAGWRQGRGSR